MKTLETDVYAFALRDTLNEISNACPDIHSIFLFKTNGDIIMGEEKTQEETAVDAVHALSEVMAKAEILGGLQTMTLEGNKGKVNVSRVGDFYVVTATAPETDMNYIQTLTGVLVRTALKVIEKVTAIPKKSLSETDNEEKTYNSKAKAEASIEKLAENEEENVPSKSVSETAHPEPQASQFIHESQEEEEEGPAESVSETVRPEPAENQFIDEDEEELEPPESVSERIRPEPQASQFIVENIGGLFSPSDVVRVDNHTISQWTMQYETEKIEEVTIEPFGGKSMQCKLRPMKDSKYEDKGIIQIPEKIQHMLDVKKGELVRVKPVIE